MDESDRQINFNNLKKSAISLPTTIAIMNESDRQINFNNLKKYADDITEDILKDHERLRERHLRKRSLEDPEGSRKKERRINLNSIIYQYWM
jgi:hypothetical protein